MSKEKATEKINSQLSPNGGKKHTGLIIAIAAIIFCALVGVILYLVLGKDSKQKTQPPVATEEPTKYNLVVTPENVDETIAQLTEADKTPIGSYEAKMNSEWTFENGNTASENAYVENTVHNQNTVYFTVALKDDDRVIYKSPYLAPGSKLENIKLDTQLEAGVYDAILTYHLVDEENQEVSNVNLTVIITINH